MAYDFFPKSETELRKGIKSYPKPLIEEVVAAFNYLSKLDKTVDTPINIDRTASRIINVNRKLKPSVDLDKATKSLKLKSLKMKFGNGSAGNRGANNKGADFEKKFEADLLNWWQGKTSNIDPKSLTAIEGLDAMYGFSRAKKFEVISEGSANTKRPIQFGDNGITLLNAKGKGLDVGKSISDITVKYDNNEVYLSLKSSTTVTFFNVGVRTILTPEDIKAGKINNANGKRLLKLFGIDEKMFCDTFNDKLDPKSKDPKKKLVQTPKVNKNDIENLLESGIGYGYHILHQFPKVIQSKKMDKKAMKDSATIVGDVTVYYGGQSGGGKRIDIVFESKEYSFKLNIRNTQGTDVYPTRLMCDFKHK